MDLHAHEEARATFRPKPDGESDPAGEAGWFLQRERERCGLSLEDIAEATGIHPHHIEAIELGDLTRLPARLEALRMAGLYAQLLGFDPEPLVYHYAAILPKPQAVAPQAASAAAPPPLSSAKILGFGRFARLPRAGLSGLSRGAGGVVASCLAAIVLFGAASWYLKPAEDAAAPAAIAAGDPLLTATTAEPAEADQTGAVKLAEEAMPEERPPAIDSDIAAAVEPAAGEPAAEPGEPSGTVDGLTEFIAEKVAEPKGKAPEAKPKPAPPAPGEPQAAGEGWTYGGENGASRLALKARAPVWVRIEDARGEVVMTQMLMKGDRYQVPAREGLVVIARDGGLLAYEIDGQERGILGPPGEILVGKSLDLKALEEKG